MNGVFVIKDASDLYHLTFGPYKKSPISLPFQDVHYVPLSLRKEVKSGFLDTVNEAQCTQLIYEFLFQDNDEILVLQSTCVPPIHDWVFNTTFLLI